MFAGHPRRGDGAYARLVTSRRVDGRVVRETSDLGRVVDRERHVFRSRERGTSALDPGTGELGPAPAGGWPAPPERLVLDFGDAWATSEGLWSALDAASPADPDGPGYLCPRYALAPRGPGASRAAGRGRPGARRLPLGPPRAPARASRGSPTWRTARPGRRWARRGCPTPRACRPRRHPTTTAGPARGAVPPTCPGGRRGRRRACGWPPATSRAPPRPGAPSPSPGSRACPRRGRRPTRATGPRATCAPWGPPGSGSPPGPSPT